MTRRTARAAAVATLLVLATPVIAQQLQDDGCLYLTGNTACPGFDSQYVNVEDLKNDWPFFSRVYDIQDFDRYALQYINGVAKTKLDDQFGCSNAESTVLRYERTVLCARWTSAPSSIQCDTSYLGLTTPPKQICASTCETNYQSMQDIGSNSTICGQSSGGRDNQISADYAACTAVASQTTGTCVSGDMNEHNCGFGNSTTQVCGFCSTTPEKCCTEPNFDISGLCQLDPTSLSSSAAANTATAGSGASKSGSKKSGISGGAIAGIVVGVVGGIALIAVLAFCLWRRKRKASTSGRLLHSPTEKDNGRWGKTSPITTAQNSPEVTSGAVVADSPIARQHTNTSPVVPAAGVLASQNLPTRGESTGVGSPTAPVLPPKSAGTISAGKFAAAPSAAPDTTGPSTGSNHGGAIAGATAAGAAVAGVGALATKQRRDAPSPPPAKRNVSPPAPIAAPHQPMPQPMPQPHPSTTPTAAAFPHVPSSPPRPLPTPPTQNMSPTSPKAYSPPSSYSHHATSASHGGPASPPRSMPSVPAPQPALAAAPPANYPAPAQSFAAQPNFAAAPPQPNFGASPPPAGTGGSGNMAGVGAGAAAAAAAAAAVGSDTTRLQRLELPKGSGIWIEEGSQVVAQHPYTAALVDELTLKPGLHIVVQEIYDDGWARGVVSAGGDPNQLGRVGQFPTVCVVKA